MIPIVFNLLIFFLIFGIAYWAITQIPLPAPFGTIAHVVLALLAILVLLSAAGALPGGGFLRF